jgi:hypothetical protein
VVIRALLQAGQTVLAVWLVRLTGWIVRIRVLAHDGLMAVIVMLR